MRLTTAQALVRFLASQFVERDGLDHRFVEGCFGIFGHGNLTGVGQALAQNPELLTYYQARNEQAMVHAAVGYARMNNRLSMMACTSSIGPGAITAWEGSSNQSTRSCGAEKPTTRSCVFKKKVKTPSIFTAELRITLSLVAHRAKLRAVLNSWKNQSRNSPNICAHGKEKTSG